MTSTPAVFWRPQPFFSHSVASISQIDQLNAERDIAVDFRPIRGIAPSIAFEGGRSSSISLWRTTSRSGFLTIPKVDVDVVNIRFIVEGAMVRRSHGGEYIGQPGRAMMVMFDTMRNEEASSGFVALSAAVMRTALMNAQLALEGPDSSASLPHFLPIVDSRTQGIHSLMQMMEKILLNIKVGIQSADLIFPLIEEVTIYRLITFWPRVIQNKARQVASLDTRPFKRATDYIDEHIGEKLLLADIAAAAGVGVRRLQLAFKTELGKTPVQYILERRLDRVHNDLRASVERETPIGIIAARWGFTHMGDFNRRYRKRFGEVPSATQRS